MKSVSESLKNFIKNPGEPLDEQLYEALDERADKVRAMPQNAIVPARAKRGPARAKSRAYSVLSALSAVLLCAAFIALLMYTVMDMPYFGSALMDNELSAYYVENTLEDTGAENIVTGIILNYRGFDTLGEAHVLFIAVCSVIILLRLHPSEHGAQLRAYEYDDGADEPHDDDILKTGTRLLTPAIFMFGVYIILNGSLSPGGGFSGGAVLGAGMILYVSVNGYARARVTRRAYSIVTCVALGAYAVMKGYHFITGANGLKTAGAGAGYGIFSGGILLPLNICVGAVVAISMYALFTMFRKGDF